MSLLHHFRTSTVSRAKFAQYTLKTPSWLPSSHHVTSNNLQGSIRHYHHHYRQWNGPLVETFTKTHTLIGHSKYQISSVVPQQRYHNSIRLFSSSSSSSPPVSPPPPPEKNDSETSNDRSSNTGSSTKSSRVASSKFFVVLGGALVLLCSAVGYYIYHSYYSSSALLTSYISSVDMKQEMTDTNAPALLQVLVPSIVKQIKAFKESIFKIGRKGQTPADQQHAANLTNPWQKIDNDDLQTKEDIELLQSCVLLRKVLGKRMLNEINRMQSKQLI
jgi:hypothetical protein